jgi:hypothetical protein
MLGGSYIPSVNRPRRRYVMNPWFPTNLVSLQKKKIMLPIAGDILIEKAAPKFECRRSDSQEWVACYLQNRKKIRYRELNKGRNNID